MRLIHLRAAAALVLAAPAAAAGPEDKKLLRIIAPDGSVQEEPEPVEEPVDGDV